MKVLKVKRAVRKKITRERDRKAGRYREELIARATPAEKALRVLLDRQGWRYVFQSCAVHRDDPTLFIPDFRLWPKNGRRLYVELDGGYHKERAAYDARRTQWLEDNRHAIVVRFENAQVFNDPDAIIQALAAHDLQRKHERRVSEVIRTKKRDPHQPSPCRLCHRFPTGTKVVTYKNGAQHRVWWCLACARQVGGNPIPRALLETDVSA